MRWFVFVPVVLALCVVCMAAGQSKPSSIVEMLRQKKAAARAAWKGSGEAADSEVWFDIAERVGATEFTGYTSTTGEALRQIRGGTA